MSIQQESYEQFCRRLAEELEIPYSEETGYFVNAVVSALIPHDKIDEVPEIIACRAGVSSRCYYEQVRNAIRALIAICDSGRWPKSDHAIVDAVRELRIVRPQRY